MSTISCIFDTRERGNNKVLVTEPRDAWPGNFLVWIGFGDGVVRGILPGTLDMVVLECTTDDGALSNANYSYDYTGCSGAVNRECQISDGADMTARRCEPEIHL